MLQLNSVMAWVTVDGIALDHYDVEVSAEKKELTCWIPSQEGKEFAVHFKAPTYAPCTLEGWVLLDGSISQGEVFPCEPEPTKATISTVVTSSTSERPFTFSRLDLTDDDSYLNSKLSQQLGEIALEVWTVARMGSYDMPEYKRIVPESTQVHERTKKCLAHRIKLGGEIKTPARQFISTSRIDRLATFTFKYRSLEILRAIGIVPVEPRAGTKRRAPEPEDAVESDSDELIALQAKIDAIRARKQAKKGDKSKKVKLETRNRPLVSGEVIDLT